MRPVPPLRQASDPVLRQRCRKVGKFGRNTKRLAQTLRDAVRAYNGMGLAAPQIGIPVEAIVLNFNSYRRKPLVMFNPSIHYFMRGEPEWFSSTEACLSLPGVQWSVPRLNEQFWVKYHNERGQVDHFLVATPLEAACVQHEIDHLRGRLITDYAPHR